MQYVKLGGSDFEVSRIAFGCWSIIGGFNWGPQDESDSVAAMRAAFEAGVNFYDSAEGYGNGESERLVARGLGSDLANVILATKASPDHLAPADLRHACEQSLDALGLDTIALYQIHWYNPTIPLADTVGELQNLQREGKVRQIGVSNFGPKQLAEALATGVKIVSNQLSYSLLCRAIEFEILPMCQAHGIDVICYSPLMQGLLTGKYTSPDQLIEDRVRTRHFDSSRSKFARHGTAGCETETFALIESVRKIAAEIGQPMDHVALAWLLAQPGVASVIVGARNREQALRNAAAIDLTLTAEQVASLSAASEKVKQALGANADMWAPPSGSRIF